MKFIYIGDIVNTHGLKGEVRILSDFKYKSKVFKAGFTVYVGRMKEPLVLTHHRVHKDYDMVTFEGITDINDVIGYKGDKVYINREDIKIRGYFDEDYIGLSAYVDDKNIGEVTYILKSKAHDILVIDDHGVKHMVPNIKEFVKKVDLKEKRIEITEMKGLINED